jgi:hypothetical protein
MDRSDIIEVVAATGVILGAAAAMIGLSLLIDRIWPPAPQQINVTVHLDQPIQVQLVPAK